MDYDLNAIGYAQSQDLVYGIGNHGHLIRVDRSGAATDLGFVRGVPHGGLALATAGAVVGGDLVVREDGWLVSIDITPSSATFQKVVRIVRLWPLADDVGDFAVDPVDGLLYGVSASLFGGPVAVVSIDPASGAVRRVATPAGLPHGASYGAVVIDAARTMYVVDNGGGHRSRLFAIPWGGAASELASGEPDESTDAAGCLSVPVSPPPPPTKAAPTTPPPPPVMTTVPPPPAPTPARPAPAVAPPPPPQRPVTTPPPTTEHAPAIPVTTPVAAPVSDEKTQQRRWALTTVILIIGGGAAATSAARRRAR